MNIVITDLSGVTKAQLSGRLDTANVNGVESEFTSGVLPLAQNTIVDLSDVSFIASLGIRMLLGAARGLSVKGARLVMFGATPPVMEIIETTALSDTIPVFGSEEDAVAAVSA